MHSAARAREPSGTRKFAEVIGDADEDDSGDDNDDDDEAKDDDDDNDKLEDDDDENDDHDDKDIGGEGDPHPALR